jgi:P4 family phage/plasmid primase-like protien
MNMSSNMNNNDNYDLFKFLDERIVGHGQPHTHTSMFNSKAAYFIRDEDMPQFYELYEIEYFKGTELHITEKREVINPMVVDLDFKLPFDTITRIVTESHIRKIDELYKNEISNLLNIDINDPKMVSFIFLRENIYKTKGITKDGIHIIFPFIINRPEAFYHIRENILKKISSIISDLGLTNSISDVVDRSVISPNTLWLLLGSNKDKPKGDPYKLSYIFDGNSNKIAVTDYFDFENQTINLVRFFSIRNKKESEIIPIRDDKLSLFNATTVKKKSTKKSSISYNYDEIKELVSMLSEERVENYSTWLDVGWTLHNIDPNSQELLDLWIDFSKKSNKFQEGRCEKEWEKSRSEGLNKGTLYHWAKIDNYQRFMEFKRKDISPFIERAINTQTNYDVAYVIFKLREHDFFYSNDEWYMYKDHKWGIDIHGTSIRKLISTDLFELFAKKISDNNILYGSSNITDEEKEEIKKKNKTITELTKKVKTTSYKENIMKECKELFTNNDYIKKFDSNPFLLGFTNGVFDLKKGELRDGRPEDFIQMNTEIEKIDFDDTDENWPDLKQFLDTVFYEEEIRDYFLSYLASCLQGHNAEEKFRVWNGRGCHAYDTDIMMSDGTIKKVQDIVEGDKLMGDDSTERNVIELKRGLGDMYQINYSDNNSFIVNNEHILCLVRDYSDDIIEMSVIEYLMLNNDIKNTLCLYNDKKNKFKFDIKYIGHYDYYGFELDGNHRYLMGNCIVTHNSNGKSKLLELFVHSIGQYAIKFPVTMLTGKRAQSNACSPELVRAKGCRFGYLEEPGENERIEVGFLKELTGGDKITARGLHKEPIDFKPQFKLALLCNEIPKVPPNDAGTWRRMEVIEFKSHFVENPKDVGEFPIDKQLSEKLKNWREMFMALLLDVYYAKYKLNGLRVPEEITKFTTEYQKTCDLYIDFIIENIEETKENTDSIDITQFYDEFKIWYEDCFSNNKYPNKTEFKKYLKKKYSKRMSQTDIKGFKFRIKYDKQGNIISPSYMVGKKIPLNEMKPENLVDVDSKIESPKIMKEEKKEEKKIVEIVEPIVPNNIIQINNKSVVKLETPISDNELTNDVDEELLIQQIPDDQIVQDVQTMAGY